MLRNYEPKIYNSQTIIKTNKNMISLGVKQNKSKLMVNIYVKAIFQLKSFNVMNVLRIKDEN